MEQSKLREIGDIQPDEVVALSNALASYVYQIFLESIFVHDGIKIPSRTIVLQAWVSCVVCHVSCVVSPILKMGLFLNALS